MYSETNNFKIFETSRFIKYVLSPKIFTNCTIFWFDLYCYSLALENFQNFGEIQEEIHLTTNSASSMCLNSEFTTIFSRSTFSTLKTLGLDFVLFDWRIFDRFNFNYILKYHWAKQVHIIHLKTSGSATLTGLAKEYFVFSTFFDLENDSNEVESQ